jgi:hypothetical protein
VVAPTAITDGCAAKPLRIGPETLWCWAGLPSCAGSSHSIGSAGVPFTGAAKLPAAAHTIRPRPSGAPCAASWVSVSAKAVLIGL